MDKTTDNVVQMSDLRRKIRATLALDKDTVLRYMSEHHERTGYWPTMREICAGTGINSATTVWKYLNDYKARGLVEVQPNKRQPYRRVGATPCAKCGHVPEAKASV